MSKLAELFKAAQGGNVDFARKLLTKNPLLLVDASLASPMEDWETPLHTAIKAGRAGFVRFLMVHRPEFAAEMRYDGLRPLDIAASLGNVDIVRELLGSDVSGGRISRLKGREGWTALHHAAAKGRLEVIEELQNKDAGAVEDLTDLGETALHLAVKLYQLEAFQVLLKHVVEASDDRSLLSCRDRDGNTVWDLAACGHQLPVLELLNTSPSSDGPTEDSHPSLKFDMHRDPPNEARSALLVVAALIATVTFQAGITPPTLLINWQARPTPTPTTTSFHHGHRMDSQRQKIKAALAAVGAAVMSAIFGTPAGLLLFLFLNTLGLTAALNILIYLTRGLPLQTELWFAFVSIMLCYASAIGSVTKDESIALVVIGVAFAVPYVARWFPRWDVVWLRWCPKRAAPRPLDDLPI